jgi:hypothetical protein
MDGVTDLSALAGQLVTVELRVTCLPCTTPARSTALIRDAHTGTRSPVLHFDAGRAACWAVLVGEAQVRGAHILQRRLRYAASVVSTVAVRIASTATAAMPAAQPRGAAELVADRKHVGASRTFGCLAGMNASEHLLRERDRPAGLVRRASDTVHAAIRFDACRLAVIWPAHGPWSAGLRPDALAHRRKSGAYGHRRVVRPPNRSLCRSVRGGCCPERLTAPDQPPSTNADGAERQRAQRRRPLLQGSIPQTSVPFRYNVTCDEAT